MPAQPAVAGSMSFQGEVIGWVAIHRPYTTRHFDRAANLWPLALLSFGESWHNMDHSDPVCARHGAGPRQVDISAAVIRVFERLGWATAVRWPDPVRLAARRRPAAQDRPRAALPPPGR